jgi:alcohol dehydrogenase
LRKFQHLSPSLRLFQGGDCLGNLGRELERENSGHAVIFCGATLSREKTLLSLVTDALGARCAGVFSGVRGHSPAPAVEAGARELESMRADAVIAIGGGSAIVTARAASILLAEKGGLASLATSIDERGAFVSPKLNAPKLPQYVIPTTPTTAAVKAGSAVFDVASGKRLPLFDPKTRAKAIFIHPDFVASAPRELVVGAALNTFSLAIEGLLSHAGDPLADASLIHAARLLTTHLPGLQGHDDVEARVELCLAAVLCGRGTDHTGAGMTTVLGHALGAGHGVDPGHANAILLPYVLRFNAAHAAAGLAKVALALGASDGSEASVRASMAALFAALGVPTRLRDLGVAAEALPDAAAHAIGDWFLRGNPRPVRDASELLQVLQAAW